MKDKINENNIYKDYETNQDLKGYVDRIAQSRHITVQDAMKLKVTREYYKSLLKGELK